MRPIQHKHLPALLRLIFVEALPYYIFYASFTDVLTNLWSFCYLWSLPSPIKQYSPGKFNYEVLNDMWTAIFTVDPHFTGEVVELKNNYSGLINYGCLLICFFGIFYQAWVTLVRGGFDACSGRYLASLWNADENPTYKALAAVMGIYTLAAIVATLLGFEVENTNAEIMAFIFYKIELVIVIIADAFALATHRSPEFEYESEEFDALRFHRDWMDLLLQPSSVFMAKLQSAILHAHAGNRHPLKELLENEEDIEVVLRVCTFPDDNSEVVGTEEELKEHLLELMG